MNRDNRYLLGNKFAVGAKPNKTSFKKGIIPWNKGKFGYMGANQTSFKKGQKGINWKPVGIVSVRKDKSGTERHWIKISEPNIWIEKAKYMWLKSQRKLIQGMCLHHINNNSSDDRLDNLILVSRKDHPKLHNRWNTKNGTRRQTPPTGGF